MFKNLKTRNTFTDSFVIFWFFYLALAMWLLAINQTNILVGFNIALVLTTPLRDRWV